MKRILNKLIAVLLIATLAVGLTACKEIENGSEIHRVKITLNLYDSDGNSQTCDVYAKLYVNYAPDTVAHIEKLINDGYYNGVCISGTGSAYAQFGDATLADDGKLSFKDQGATVKGEFEKNGHVGNPLSCTSGALVLKHDAEGANRYDSGKATIAVAFSSSSFDKSSYCIFGKLVDDDGDTSADEDSLAYKSSLEKMRTLIDLAKDDDGTYIYYCDEYTAEDGKTYFGGEYYTYAKNGNDDDAEYHYYKGFGNSAISDANEISGDDLDEFTTKKNAKNSVIRAIPAKSVVISKIVIVK